MFILKDFEIFSTSEKGAADRAHVLENAAVLERLRERLPGWVSRGAITDSAGKQTRLWPVAVAKFKLPVVPHNSTAPTPPRFDDEAFVDGEAQQPVADEPLIVAIWRVAGGSDDKPLVFLSAAKFDRFGFEARDIDDYCARRIGDEICGLWNKQQVRIVNEFTLTPPRWIRQRIDSRLGLLRSAGDPDLYEFRREARENLVVRATGAAAEALPGDGEKLFDGIVADDDGKRRVAALQRLIAEDASYRGGPPIDAGANVIEVYGRKTTFYEGLTLYRLIEARGDLYVIAPDWDDLVPAETQHEAQDETSAVTPPDRPVAVLDGMSLTIHALNARLGDRLRISDATVTDYLAFFCKFVHGEDGAFLVIQSASDIRWKDFPAVDADRRTAVDGRVVFPVAVTRDTEPPARSDDDASDIAEFLRLATINYGRDLFVAVFSVNAKGGVQMLEDHWLIKHLPVTPFTLQPAGKPARDPRG